MKPTATPIIGTLKTLAAAMVTEHHSTADDLVTAIDPNVLPSPPTNIENPLAGDSHETLTFGQLATPNPIVIYHANCADGFAAAWVFHHMGKLYGVEYDFHKGVYGDNPPDCTGRLVYLVDFSYKQEVVKIMCQEATKVVLIDHHKTAIDDLLPLTNENVNSGLFCANFQMYTDLARSGAVLAWDFWHTTPNGTIISAEKDIECPLLMSYIQDRDLWQFKLHHTRAISAALFSYPYDFKVWTDLMLMTPTDLFSLITEGNAIERKHLKDIAELILVTMRYMVIGMYTVPVASLPYTYSSDAAHFMARDYVEGTTFAACYWDTPTSRCFSLRSTDNGMDVSEVAKAYGGGGHKHAAGFSVPRDHILARS